MHLDSNYFIYGVYEFYEKDEKGDNRQQEKLRIGNQDHHLSKIRSKSASLKDDVGISLKLSK